MSEGWGVAFSRRLRQTQGSVLVDQCVVREERGSVVTFGVGVVGAVVVVGTLVMILLRLHTHHHRKWPRTPQTTGQVIARQYLVPLRKASVRGNNGIIVSCYRCYQSSVELVRIKGTTRRQRRRQRSQQ